MPPVNSPSDPPAQSSSSASSLRPLTALSIPVPSLPAAVSDDTHDDNVSFLRSRVRSPPDSSTSLSRQRRRRRPNLSDLDLEPMDLEDPSNLRIEINRRIPIVRRQRDGSGNPNPNNLPNYEGQMSNPRSVYGWAPASDDDDYDVGFEPLHDSNTVSWFGRFSDRYATARRHARRDAAGRSPTLPDEPSDSSSHRQNESPGSTTEAFLWSARRQPRSSRTRTLHDYLLDRERTLQDSDESRERPGPTSASRAYRFMPGTRGESHRFLTHNDLRARISAHRQLHMENPPNPRLKETIRYLDRLRFSTSFEESLTSAAAGGFVNTDFLGGNEDDFILDTTSIAPPPECSWLRPGVVFSGSQRAASSANSIFARIPSPSTSQDPVIVNGSDNNNRISVYTTTGRRYLANNIYNLGSGKDENWPVKVTIHSINPDDMTLSGTMEAYNIPDKTTPAHDAHIVTYLEGEIIDFNTHTLETKNFKADAEIDSTYWRELQPFKDLTDEEMTRNLVSRKWVTEQLSRRWILMRWKERCFITPTDSRQGLTISGFYYISLNRQSGQIEGLYYDPGSSPYQQLSLKPETRKMVCPSYGFR
ncbi:hypothetical protein BO94DRAFT_619887 [Aspergillus sclerotioniger CBS 115572]|uniref:Vacuolar import and degradation protein n=1 Tax=Aspergillus sclerotioniger CBS 115572 TaxID=1450535 RepID=A0A317XAN1_9EURO|nr:hypothetical protein BO94DRAFT_619887 [Aspergillus sclerotioniger CBS 115572]PWY95455.1 hypothetical protein BO94DRAFT_619887 [Aspergillus sclerotioniger CBS 115572]